MSDKMEVEMIQDTNPMLEDKSKDEIIILDDEDDAVLLEPSSSSSVCEEAMFRECPICTYYNPGDRSECEICLSALSDAEVQFVGHSDTVLDTCQPSEDEKDADQDEQDAPIAYLDVWACEKCTFENPLDQNVCELCLSERHADESKEQVSTPNRRKSIDSDTGEEISSWTLLKKMKGEKKKNPSKEEVDCSPVITRYEKSSSSSSSISMSEQEIENMTNNLGIRRYFGQEVAENVNLLLKQQILSPRSRPAFSPTPLNNFAPTPLNNFVQTPSVDHMISPISRLNRESGALNEDEKKEVLNMFSQLSCKDLVGVDAPDNVICSLYPHQKLALEFMLNCEKNRAFRGGIIADVMGMGKVSAIENFTSYSYYSRLSNRYRLLLRQWVLHGKGARQRSLSPLFLSFSNGKVKL
jgi:hypothetical protein